MYIQLYTKYRFKSYFFQMFNSNTKKNSFTVYIGYFIVFTFLFVFLVFITLFLTLTFYNTFFLGEHLIDQLQLINKAIYKMLNKGFIVCWIRIFIMSSLMAGLCWLFGISYYSKDKILFFSVLSTILYLLLYICAFLFY
jgi:hypothetical protein